MLNQFVLPEEPVFQAWDDECQSALAMIVHYLCNYHSMNRREIFKDAGLDSAQYNEVLTPNKYRKDKNILGEPRNIVVRRAVYKTLSQLKGGVAPFLKDVIPYVYDVSVRDRPKFVTGVDKVHTGFSFLKFMDPAFIKPSCIKQVMEVYGGVHTTYRRSGNVPARLRASQAEGYLKDPDLSVTAIHIFEGDNEYGLPEYRNIFRSQDTKSAKSIHEISGMVIPYEGYIYMIGMDGRAKYPQQIILPFWEDTEDVDKLGLVLRRHIKASPFAAKILLKKEQAVSISDVKNKLGVFRGSVLVQDENSHLEERDVLTLSNIPNLFGEGVLYL